MVETGVHDGIGSLVLLSALDRNALEGETRQADAHSMWIPVLAGSSASMRGGRSVLRTRTGGCARIDRCDLFLHDSLHTYLHERMELEYAAAAGAVLMSDNTNTTDALKDVCAAHGLRCSIFQERPQDHFYLGAQIGVGLR